MDRQPVNLGVKPDGLSPSRVTQFHNCPRQYQYTSIEKLPEKKSLPAFRGTVFHAIMELMFNESMDTPHKRTIENCLEFFRQVFPIFVNDEACEELELTEQGKSELAADLTKHIRTYYKMEDPTKVNCVHTEIRYDYSMGNWGVRGIIDRLDRQHDGTLEIVDYKTGKPPRPGYEMKALEACEVYAFLCQEVVGERPTSMRLLYVKTGTTIQHPVSEGTITKAVNRVTKTWNAIEKYYEQGYFPPKPSALCNWCAFKTTCDQDRNQAF